MDSGAVFLPLNCDKTKKERKAYTSTKMFKKWPSMP